MVNNSVRRKLVLTTEFLNVALLGMPAGTWRAATEGRAGNLRDDAALGQLVQIRSLLSNPAAKRLAGSSDKTGKSS